MNKITLAKFPRNGSVKRVKRYIGRKDASKKRLKKFYDQNNIIGATIANVR